MGWNGHCWRLLFKFYVSGVGPIG